ncbi:hypothetical protein [Methylobacterium soli]|uniref:Uncharacterized protein n=1 Tax=Methylobacterium soli TaxID=553447 RepID=A0A6L3T0W4_9HYPH|nr:hypothetical protein [Methylobacterium soli]KAB1079400.1 hypothetical protein F6X53_11395 [Methylobacterium soli]GJE42076.1 hypothetical protein AEGHOMDF_1247 [Methylobacterium soli]
MLKRALVQPEPGIVTFQATWAAALGGREQAQLGWVDGSLAVVLLPAVPGWFLHTGFGPCDAEGLVFHTLAEAREWILHRYAQS